MHEIQGFLAKANKLFEVADHLAYVTYPIVKEPKLGFTIVEHAFNACVSAMDALLFYERMYKRIDVHPDNFAAKADLFKRIIAPRYSIDRKQIFAVEEMHSLLRYRQKSQMEFIRKDKLVICNPDYELRILTMDKVKNYVLEAKNFLSKVNNLLKTQNARRY